MTTRWNIACDGNSFSGRKILAEVKRLTIPTSHTRTFLFWYFRPLFSCMRAGHSTKLKGAEKLFFQSFQSLLDTWLAGPKHDIARPLMDQVAEQFAPSLFVRRTPRELIHEGYHDDLIEYIERWLQFRRDLTLWGRPLFKAKFAALLFRNWTGSQEFDEMESSFPFTINTGQTDPNRAWDIVGWNGRKANTCWTDACAQVGGQEGGVFPSPINRRQTIRVFSHDLYRSGKLLFLINFHVNQFD